MPDRDLAGNEPEISSTATSSPEIISEHGLESAKTHVFLPADVLRLENRTPVYMDYNATTPLHSEVLRAMTNSLEHFWKNPSSSYAGTVRDVISTARRQVADLMGADEEEIIFTSTGTEANNWILESVLRNATFQPTIGRPHVLTTDIEHDAVVKKLEDLQLRGLCEVEKVPALNEGHILSNDVISRCRPTTCLVSVMLANNETGVIQPVAELGAALKILNSARVQKGEHRIYFHSDTAQCFGKIPVNVDDLCVDFLTVVGHKFYGPRCGALYCRKQFLHLMKPLFFGGGQERNLRPGTENTANIVGLGKAAEMVKLHGETWRVHFGEMGRYFASTLKAKFGDIFQFNFCVNNQNVLPNTFSLHFCDGRCKNWLVLQNAQRTEASTAAACHSGKRCASAVLLNSGVLAAAAENTIRFSIGKDTSRTDIDVVVADLAEAVRLITQKEPPTS